MTSVERQLGSGPFGRTKIRPARPGSSDGFEHLTSYTVDVVTRVPEGVEAPYDGVATLTWEDRDGFKADMGSEANARATEHLKTFTSGAGLLFVDHHVVK